jgi:hypothetical protein
MSIVSSRAGGYGHAAKNPPAALFEAFEHQYAGGEIDPVGGQRQGFGKPAAGIRQGQAEGPHRAIGQVGFSQEGIALASGQIFAGSVGGMQSHADLWGRGGGLGAALPGAALRSGNLHDRRSSWGMFDRGGFTRTFSGAHRRPAWRLHTVRS